MTTCSIDGCTLKTLSRGWCSTHYGRWFRWGDPLGSKAAGSTRRPYNAKPRPVCAVEGCDNLSAKSCKGWCVKHCRRWYRHGDPSIVRKPTIHYKDPAATIRERVVDVDGCWIWQGATLPNGYGVFGIGGAQRYVHRAAYELFVGPIPSKHDVHHVCGNRGCCNPEHLRALSRLEHVRAHRSAKAIQTEVAA